MEELIAVIVALAGALLVDGFVRPFPSRRFVPWRSRAGSWILLLLHLAGLGTFIAIGGNPLLAAVLVLALHILLVVASNAKRRMLGEPLVFSDLALVGAIFRHPQFYLSAVAGWQKAASLCVAILLVVALAWLFRLAPYTRLAGVVMAIVSISLLALSFRANWARALAREPDAEADVARLGLLPTLLLYWLRWRASDDPPTVEPLASGKVGAAGSSDASPLVVVVQCESFADPVELFGNPSHALPGLEVARREAVQWGNLLVSGFGAYTMRTEYGVLFGREEDTLGFRRFDPFLTALGEASHGLPNKLDRRLWRSLFVHPHDMRFYNRHKVLPAAGFAEMVGHEAFDPPGDEEGRYVTDAAVARKILSLAGEAEAPTLIYAVTMENHGPWSSSEGTSASQLMQNYRRLVGAGDAMLSQLRNGLAELRRPALLVFFGDHRPSIPDVSEPGGDRHTPYVIMRFNMQAGGDGQECEREDLTPAQLHRAILDHALVNRMNGN